MSKDLQLLLDKDKIEETKKAAKNAKVVEEKDEGDAVRVVLRFPDVEDSAKFCEECAELFEPKFSDPPDDFDPIKESESS